MKNQPQVQVPSRDAGRALDALIEEKVFGRCAHLPVRWSRDEVIARERAEFFEEYGMDAPPAWTGNADVELSGDYPPYRCKKCGSDRVNSRPVYPRYSADTAAAWLVVEKILSERYGGFDLRNHGTWTAVVTCGLSHWSEDADTAPLAICRAALAAVEAV